MSRPYGCARARAPSEARPSAVATTAARPARPTAWERTRGRRRQLRGHGADACRGRPARRRRAHGARARSDLAGPVGAASPTASPPARPGPVFAVACCRLRGPAVRGYRPHGVGADDSSEAGEDATRARRRCASASGSRSSCSPSSGCSTSSAGARRSTRRRAARRRRSARRRRRSPVRGRGVVGAAVILVGVACSGSCSRRACRCAASSPRSRPGALGRPRR